ncbi:hypothetical protein [Polaromonas sp. CG9_12]|nr:hypothetical protein [Polaromonas sp. CG9_12]
MRWTFLQLQDLINAQLAAQIQQLQISTSSSKQVLLKRLVE